MSESHASTLKFQDYFTSPLFTILVGKNEFPFTVHSEVLREKIPALYTAIDKEGSSENGTKVIRWADRAPQTIASLVQWLYTGEYECILPVVIPRCNPGPELTSKSPEPDQRDAASLESDCEDADSNASQIPDFVHGSTSPTSPTQHDNTWRVQSTPDGAENLEDEGELEAKSARFASMFAHPTTAKTPTASGTKARDEQRTLHAARIAREISKPLPPDPFLFSTASDLGLRGKQLSKLQTQLSIPSKWAPRRDSIDRELSLLQHVNVYGLAQSLGVSGLEEFAVHAIHIVLDVVNYCVFIGEAIAMRNVVCLIKAVYENTAAGSLRESVAIFAALKHRKLLGCLEYTELLQSGGVFVVDLAVNLERAPASKEAIVAGISRRWKGPSFGKAKVLFGTAV